MYIREKTAFAQEHINHFPQRCQEWLANKPSNLFYSNSYFIIASRCSILSVACFVKISKAKLTVTHNIYCHASKSSPLFLLLLHSPHEIVLIWPLRRTAKQRETWGSSWIPSFLSGWSPEWCVAPRPELLVQRLLEHARTCLASRFLCLTLEIDMIHTCFQRRLSLKS